MKFGDFCFKLLFPKRVKEIEMLRAFIKVAQEQLLEKDTKIQMLAKELEVLKLWFINPNQPVDNPYIPESAFTDFYCNSLLKDQAGSLLEFLSKPEKNKTNRATVSGANSGGLPDGVKLRQGPNKSIGVADPGNYVAARFSEATTDDLIGAGILATLLNDGGKMVDGCHREQNFVAGQSYPDGSGGEFGGAGSSGSFEIENPKKRGGDSVENSILSYKETAPAENGYITALLADTLTLKKVPPPEVLCTADKAKVQEVSEQCIENSRKVEEVPNPFTIVNDTSVVEVVRTEIAPDPEPSIDFDCGSSSSDSYSSSSD